MDIACFLFIVISMAKSTSSKKLEKRDWAIIVLIVAVITIGWYAYQINQARMLSENADSQAWLNHQIQINKLKACIDENTKPCDISPQIQQ
jgi:hypothetical protein